MLDRLLLFLLLVGIGRFYPVSARFPDWKERV